MSQQAKEVRAVFLESVQRTPTVFSFRFGLKEKIVFLPGQFMEVVLNPDDKNLRHFLSFSCASQRPYIEFTKRMSESTFCQKLRLLTPGTEIVLRMPLGRYVYKDEYKKVNFIAAGIGITPVVSMLEHIVFEKLGAKILLIYANRDEAEIAFKQEIDAWIKNLGLNAVYLTDSGPISDKKIKIGRISGDLLSLYKQEFDSGKTFVFGPPKAVEAISSMLTRIGVDKSNVETEEFIGY